MFKLATYKLIYAIFFILIIMVLAVGIGFADEKPFSGDLSSIGETASVKNPKDAAAKAAQGYNQEESLNKIYTLSAEDLGYNEAEILKPIFISFHTSSLSKLKNKHTVLSSRHGRPVYVKKVTLDIAPIIEKYAKKYNVDPYLVRAIIKTESGFKPYAVSYCGAAGLMQLMPATASTLGVKNIFDPEQNIEGGTKYIRGLLDRMKDFNLAIAAYNAGPYNVLKHGGIPPFTETRNFVNRVLRYYNER